MNRAIIIDIYIVTTLTSNAIVYNYIIYKCTRDKIIIMPNNHTTCTGTYFSLQNLRLPLLLCLKFSPINNSTLEIGVSYLPDTKVDV